MNILNIILLIFILKFKNVIGQDANIVLKQGTIVGLKVFPETSKIPVYTYLGIPYAKPPIGELRFARPIPNRGWNRTLFARDYKPICPQILHNIYEETVEGFRSNGEYYRTNEDCLYLNIWTPETAFRYGNFPILVIITGEEMAFDWTVNRPSGLDLASEGIVVVTVQYRTNIFGWFGLGNSNSPLNLGLWDQNLALIWIKENIPKFGGDPNRITVLGHGTTGAACAMIHLVSQRSKDLFSKLIIMSGTLFSPYSFQIASQSRSATFVSEKIVKNLACQAADANQILDCVRKKSLNDLLKAFENVYQNGNYTNLLGPVIDDFIEKIEEKFIPDDPRKLLRLNSFNKVPIIIGITNNEGAFIHEQWIDLAKQGYKSLKKYIETSILTNSLEMLGLNHVGQKQILDAINWKFFDQIPKTNVHLLNSLQKIISEVKFELPFFETIEILSSEGRIINSDEYTNHDNKDEFFNVNNLNANESKNVQKFIDRDDVMYQRPKIKVAKRKINEQDLFVYSFQQSNSIDMRGKVNLFGGSSHSADLPFLMGPSLFQQISRRRLTQNEEKFCRKLRQMFCDFIKTGNPTPGRLYDAWHPYTQKQKYIKIISSSKTEHIAPEKSTPTYGFEQHMDQIEHLLSSSSEINSNNDNPGSFNPYNLNDRHANKNDRQTKNLNYANEHNNSEYFLYLTKIYSFWRILLPKISKNVNEYDRKTEMDKKLINGQIEFYENSNTTPKFKHAFFSMLTLVCLLLAILCVCIYILKKNHKNLDTSFL